MAETNPHVSHIINAREILRYWFRAESMVSVDANMFIFYQKGFPKQRVAPDVFVVWGVPKKRRRSFKLWLEEQAPQVIFEFTSRKTQDEDLGTKRAIYARLGVAEYYLFDPYGEYLRPPLRGYQLTGEEYAMRAVEALAPPTFNGKHANGSLTGWQLISERLRLELWALPTGEEDMPYTLRFFDSATGKWLPDPEQAMVERELFAKQVADAETRVKHETRAREAVEAELAKVKAELEKLRRQNQTN